jgi:hypothetical protein
LEEQRITIPIYTDIKEKEKRKHKETKVDAQT